MAGSIVGCLEGGGEVNSACVVTFVFVLKSQSSVTLLYSSPSNESFISCHILTMTHSLNSDSWKCGFTNA